MRSFSLKIFLTTLLSLAPHLANAAPGALDDLFGLSGKITQNIFSPMGSPSSDQINAIALQPDGKIVVAGYAATSTHSEFAAARYNSDGSRDTCFGDPINCAAGGLFTYDLFGKNSQVHAVAIQPDGKILLAGYANRDPVPPAMYEQDFTLLRLNVDGTLDPSFSDPSSPSGTAPGVVMTVFSPPGTSSIDEANALALQPDGNGGFKILVGGVWNDSTKGEFALARYLSSGHLDSTFGSGGKATFPIVVGQYDYITSMAIDSNNKILAAGSTQVHGPDSDFVIARVKANGEGLDMTFGPGGSGKRVDNLSTSFPYVDQAFAVSLLSDGQFLVGGFARINHMSGPSWDFALLKYRADGSDFDSSFGNNGKVFQGFTNLNDDEKALAMAVQPDEKILLGGCFNCDSSSGRSFGLARYQKNGNVDLSFGNNGTVATNFSNGSSLDQAFAMALQPDGKIVLGGVSLHDSTNQDFALARYLGDSSDLNITTQASPPSAAVGNMVTYHLTVSNQGPQAAMNVTVTDPLPGSVTLSSATPSQGTCSGTNLVICKLGPIAAAGQATIDLVVQANGAGVVSNIAHSQDQGTADPNLFNNTSSALLNVTGSSSNADLAITETGESTSVINGNKVSYKITVMNRGPDPAPGVTLTNWLTGPFSDLSISPSQGSCNGTDLLNCNVGTLETGKMATITFNLKTNQLKEITNATILSGAVNDPNLNNNAATFKLDLSGSGVNAQAIAKTGCQLADPLNRPEKGGYGTWLFMSGLIALATQRVARRRN